MCCMSLLWQNQRQWDGTTLGFLKEVNSAETLPCICSCCLWCWFPFSWWAKAFQSIRKTTRLLQIWVANKLVTSPSWKHSWTTSMRFINAKESTTVSARDSLKLDNQPLLAQKTGANNGKMQEAEMINYPTFMPASFLAWQSLLKWLCTLSEAKEDL